jgi:hypothetical protein
VFKLWHLPFYGAGLKAYDLLSGKAGIGATRLLGPQRVREMLPKVCRGYSDRALMRPWFGTQYAMSSHV